jgi:hypothetical protein
MLDLGTVRPGSTIRIPFNTFDKDDGSAITMTNFAAADLLVYKDGGTTERASTSGFTATTDFDGKTGKHLAVIDLSDNTTAGFFASGSEYHVAIDAVTVDAVTVGGWVARFRIGQSGAWFDTTIATLSSQTSFTLTAGPAEDDALNGHRVIIHDAASAVQCAWAIISDYTGSTKTVTLAAGATFTVAAGDNISIMDAAPLAPTVPGRTLDVSAGGEAGVDWANVGSPTTTLNLSGTTVNTVATVNGFAAGSITAAAIATDAIDADAIAASAVTEIQSGLSTLDATGVRTAVGLAAANLDTQLSALAGYVDTEVGAIKTVTDRLNGMLVLDGAVYQFTANALELGPAGGGGSGLTAQQARDAMLLAPTGAADPGSIDAILATLVPGSPVDETHSSEVEING